MRARGWLTSSRIEGSRNWGGDSIVSIRILGDRARIGSGGNGKGNGARKIVVEGIYGLCDVFFDLDFEGFEVVVFSLLANPIEEIDGEILAVEVAIEADDMGFNLAGVFAELGHGANAESDGII